MPAAGSPASGPKSNYMCEDSVRAVVILGEFGCVFARPVVSELCGADTMAASVPAHLSQFTTGGCCVTALGLIVIRFPIRCLSFSGDGEWSGVGVVIRR